MPLTTSSTTSSASGRASSSGYESMSNGAFDEMIASLPSMINNDTNTIRLRSKSTKKGSVTLSTRFFSHKFILMHMTYIPFFNLCE